MRINKLYLKNFRNYTDEQFEFDEGLNILYGKNAQGKTNCAEAIFYLCTGTSLRIRKDKQLIKLNESQAKIKADANNRYGNILLEADIYENKREIKINDSKIQKSADILGNINSVFFSPNELRLIQDGPDERRRFLNISISQNNRNYYIALIRYNKILEQRNTLLKEKNISLIYDTLPVWDEQFTRYASQIVFKRLEYIKLLAPVAKNMHGFLTNGKEELDLSYDVDYSKSEEDVYQKINDKLVSSYDKDVRLGFTTVGPHRDDLKISINGVDAKVYGSQGQMRTVALALKLAEVEIFKTLSGEYPVLILDDVLSELDLERKRLLMQKIEGLQVILTCANIDRCLNKLFCKKIKISKGQIYRKKSELLNSIVDEKNKTTEKLLTENVCEKK